MVPVGIRQLPVPDPKGRRDPLLHPASLRRSLHGFGCRVQAKTRPAPLFPSRLASDYPSWCFKRHHDGRKRSSLYESRHSQPCHFQPPVWHQLPHRDVLDRSNVLVSSIRSLAQGRHRAGGSTSQDLAKTMVWQERSNHRDGRLFLRSLLRLVMARVSLAYQNIMELVGN